jgi:hypothetical protein
MANCCNADRVYMGTGRTYLRSSERDTCSGSCTSIGTLTEAPSVGCPLNGCQPMSLCEGLPLFTAYMAPQPYTGLVCPETALRRGSAFTNLYSPYPAENAPASIYGGGNR